MSGGYSTVCVCGCEIICIRHPWEGEMGSSQHKALHPPRAFRRGLDVVTSAEINPSRRTRRCSMYFLVRISIWSGKIRLSSEAFYRECEMGWSQPISPYPTMQYVFSRTYIYLKRQNQTDLVKRFIESARWADLTIRFVMKANSMSASI